MVIKIEVKDNNVEQALRVLKRKLLEFMNQFNRHKKIKMLVTRFFGGIY